MTQFVPAMSSTSVDAKHTMSLGLDGFSRWRADAIGTIDEAIAADNAFALPHIIKGIAMVGGRNERFSPVVNACLEAANERQDGLTKDEITWLDIFRDLAEKRFEQAVLSLERYLLRNPTDLFAHRVIQQELFWCGEARWMREVVTRARPHWSGDEADFSTFLSVYAFSLEEGGDHSGAEAAGREAIERDPHDPWGAHAVAHVMEMQARHNDGIEWLEALCGNWSHANQIKHHLWWHLCMFCLEDGQHDRVLSLLDAEVRNPESPMIQAVPDAYIDIQNYASMLMRLVLRGVDVGDRWESIAEVCAARANNHPSPFTSAHAVMALAGAGLMDDAREVLETMRSCANTDSSAIGHRMRLAAVPAAEGSLRWFNGDFPGVVDVLMPTRRDMWRMGGSHAQRDVFNQILFVAARRTGQNDLLELLLHEMSSTGFIGAGERTLYSEH